MGYLIKKRNLFTSKLTDLSTNFSAKVFSKSIFGRLFSKISKALNLSIDIRVGGKTFCISKANLKKFLSQQISHDLCHFDKKTISRRVKAEISITSKKNKKINLEDFQKSIEGVVNYSLWKGFSDGLFAQSDKMETDTDIQDFNKKLKKELLKKSVRNPSTDSLIQEFIDLEEKSDKSGLFIRLISRVHRNRDKIAPAVVHFVDEITNRLTKLSVKKQSGLPPLSKVSLAERTAPRTPNEVIVDLLSYLRDHPEEKYQKIKETAKSLFMTHKANITNTRDFLNEIQANFLNDHISEKCLELEKQLMKKEIMTRFQDNIYGRTFDSAFVSELVKNPPPEVFDSMTAMSLGLATYLKKEVMTLGPRRRDTLSKGIRKLFKTKDPRFWFPLVPEIKKLQMSDEGILEGLIEYLEKPKKTGHECISIPYLMVKVSLVLRGIGLSPSWLREADATYVSTLHPMGRGIRINRRFWSPMKTPGGGITLHYQPSIVLEEGMEKSQRPTTVRKPRYESKSAQKSAKEALEKALSHGVPWASGISGSANISLYAMNYFNKRKNAEIDPKATLLGITMFLVYDGGHSIHEPLWAASLVNKQLKLGYKLGGTNRTQDFIADYEKFTNMYAGNLKNAISEAFDRSFERTLDYFKEHSAFTPKLPESKS